MHGIDMDKNVTFNQVVVGSSPTGLTNEINHLVESGESGKGDGPAPGQHRTIGNCRRDDPQRLHPQIVARFDRETFDEIAAFAECKGWSFNSALRLLVECG